ncbi:RNA methyltransferase [Parvibacter caecicola]|uniref:RNA methyltransferase n=2 Tax=Parvibacter caecicola TaxID=747645 RepID=A0A4T9T6A3_9ACTN|nr:RNA methyltransferase [Parvibacter caecicola]
MGTVFQIPWARIPADGEGEDVQRPEGKRTERETMGEDGADGGRSRGGDCGTLFGTGGAGESGEDESSGRGGMGAKGSQSAEYESARKGGGGKATSGGDRVILAADGAPSVHRGATVRAGAATGVQQLQRLGFTVAAMALEEDSLQLSAPLLQRAPRVALVFGTEGAGLEPATIAACDATVCIPMFHGVDSLNVAASSAVGFYALKGRPGEALPCF